MYGMRCQQNGELYDYQKVNLDIVIGVTSAIPQTELPEVAFAGNPTWEIFTHQCVDEP